MKITRRQIKGGELLATMKVITPPVQKGYLDAVELTQEIQTLAFTTAADIENEGLGTITLSDGCKLHWDGVQFVLLDSDDNVIIKFYDAGLPAGSRWAESKYSFDDPVSVEGIQIADRSLGPWGLAEFVCQPADRMQDFPDHADNQGNPHKVTAAQAGAYTREEIDARQSALINLGYTKGYWYGRKSAATSWPLPAAGESWAANAIKAFDFSTSKVWTWTGAGWSEGSAAPLANGMTIGISESFLDIVDKGYPGKAVYSSESKSWDFYPDKYGLDTVQKSIITPGNLSYESMANEAHLALWRKMPADGRTIPVEDSRAERLLQYCLIPHSVAVANTSIMGYYRTNDYFPDQAALAASGKSRATPAENGKYYAIPDACGLFLRGAGKNAIKKGANNTPYDGNGNGEHIGDAQRHYSGSIFGAGAAIFLTAGGAFRVVGETSGVATPHPVVEVGYYALEFSPAFVVPSSYENRPASLSALVCISY